MAAMSGTSLDSAEARLAQCWRIWSVLVLGSTALNCLVLFPIGHILEGTAFYALRLLHPISGSDSWLPMLQASTFLIDHPHTLVYQAIFFDQRVKFQYPLTSLLTLDIPRRLLHVDPHNVIAALRLLSRLSVPAIGLTFALLMKNAVAETLPGKLPGSGLRNGWLVLGVGVASAALFYPISRSEVLGQIQTLMTLLAALSLLAWQRGGKATSGLLLGLCCVVKPHWAVVVLWSLLRRQWRFSVAAMVIVAVCLLLALALYGLDNVMGYVAVVEYVGRRGESYFPNQSVNGLVNRLLFNGPNIEWEAHAFAPFHPLVYAATVASSIALLAFTMLWGRRSEPTTLHLALAILALTMASPIAWEHHYGVLFPMFALVLPAALAYRPLSGATLPILAVAFLLNSQCFVSITNLLAHSRWNIVQSYQLAGAALMLWLIALLVRPRGAGAPGNSPQ
jgi:hypothetical protein